MVFGSRRRTAIHCPAVDCIAINEREQGLQWQIGISAALHRPAARQRFACKPGEGADDPPRKQIDHDRQIQEPLMRADVSDIARHCSRTNGAQWLAPELIGGIRCPAVVCLQTTRGDIELSVQGIVGYDSRAATVRAGLLFVTNLGPDARQTCQTPRPVGADVFAEITQIIMQLAPLGRFLRNRLPGNGYP